MPEDIILLIADKTTALEKWILRKSSPSLRQTIDPQFPRFKKLTIIVVLPPFLRFEYENQIVFESDSDALHLNYIEDIAGEPKIVKRSLKEYKLEHRCENAMEAMFRDIRIIVEKLKTELTDLHLIYDDILWENLFFEHFLKNQTTVKKVTINSTDTTNFYTILSHLKPKTLQSINLQCGRTNEDFGEILKLDQWKQAKFVKYSFRDAIPMEDLIHFEECRGGRYILTPEDLVKMKNELTRIDTVKVFEMYIRPKVESIEELNDLLGPLNPDFHDTMNRRHFRIHNSEKLMRLKIRKCKIEFTLEETVNLLDEWKDCNEDEDDREQIW